MGTAAQTAGFKRICTGCGLRFYDLNKRPIICPGCSNEFTGDTKVKGRRGRASIKEEEPVKVAPVVEAEDEIIRGDDELDVVSLEDVAEDGDDDADEVMTLDDSEIEIETFEDDDLEEEAEIVPEEDED